MRSRALAVVVATEEVVVGSTVAVASMAVASMAVDSMVEADSVVDPSLSAVLVVE